MKKVRMNISHFRFILFNLKIFGEIALPFYTALEKLCRACEKGVQEVHRTRAQRDPED